MPVQTSPPHLAISLPIDPHAPRAARYYVAQVDRPSPDLRDAVVLLTSELVTRAVEACPLASPAGQSIELRVWMPEDVVRVEVRAPRALFGGEVSDDHADLDGLLFGQVADRWSVGRMPGEASSMWFEIDRHRPRVPSAM
jgi:hypothetical protein